MSIAMQDFLAFQSHMLKKQAARGAERLPAILCKHELDAGTKCTPRHQLETCRACGAEWNKNKQEEAAKDG